MTLVCLVGGLLPSRGQAQMILATPGTSLPVRQADSARHTPVDPDSGYHPGVQPTRVRPTRVPGMHMQQRPLALPMTRMGSGTSWLPDDAPMHALQVTTGAWETMVHGAEDGMYDRQIGGNRGAKQVVGLGWVMGSAAHPLGDGRLDFRGMFSADPWTASLRGYPLMLQSGEDYDGVPLHDRQHPHDLFMELAAIYDTPLTSGVAIELYAAPVGEPAVGPVAFPHRPSAENDPFAPLSHHWQDATHISYGVVTAGVYSRMVKLEGSLFNGREPDQDRTDFDYSGRGPVLDSYSARLTVNPTTALSLSTWYAFLRSPEQLEPTVSQHRMGVAVLDEARIGSESHWSSTLVYGANLYSGDRRLSNSVLLETNLDVDGVNTVFARGEYVTKSPADLAVPVSSALSTDRFDIASVAVGYVREICRRVGPLALGLGGVGTIDAIPGALVPFYHTRTPHGFAIFLQLRVRQQMGGPNSTDHMRGMHASPATR